MFGTISKGITMKTISSIFYFLFFAIVLSLAAGSALADGRVIFSSGSANIEASDGSTRVASKGEKVQSGETLLTEQGRMQVKFSDGGFVSLQPRTTFKVDDYAYNGVEDGTESAVFRLLRGGIRAITGVIGKKNKKRFAVRTRTATIGIRGTEFTALDCNGGSCTTPWGDVLPDGLYTKTGGGVIFVSNDAGSVDLPTGAGGFVSSISALPVIITAPPPTTTSTIGGSSLADTGISEVSEDESVASAFNIGAQYGEGGGQEIVVGDLPVDLIGEPSSFALFAEPDQLFIGATTGLVSAAPIGRGSLFVFTDGFQVGPNTRVSRGINGVTPPFDAVFSVSQNFDRDTTGSTTDIIVERFSNTTIDFEFAFVDSNIPNPEPVVQDTFSGNESFFQVSGSVTDSIPSMGSASYLLAGSSNSATVVEGPLGIGVTGAQIDVNFATSSVDVFYSVDHLGTVYNAFHSAEPLLSTVGAVSSAYTFGINGGVAFGGLGACSSGCFSVVAGFLSGNTMTTLGNTPASAGFTYVIGETNLINGGVALSLDPGSIAP